MVEVAAMRLPNPFRRRPPSPVTVLAESGWFRIEHHAELPPPVRIWIVMTVIPHVPLKMSLGDLDELSEAGQRAVDRAP